MRLIDIDRLCNDLAKRWCIADKKKEDLIRAVMADVVTPIVVSQPTVDAVPVVKCRECKYAHMTYDGECKYCDIWFPDEAEYMDGDYYCASGERKDGDGNG